MSLIFPKSADKYLRIGASALVVVALGAVALTAYLFHPNQADTGYQPVQPVPYSHKLHAGNLGMDCRYCHFTVEKAAWAALPPTQVCMNCHLQVKKNSPLLAAVRESWETGRPIPWVRVHKLPDYVYFNHAAHVNAGVSCVNCHGRIDQMAEVRQVQPLSMAWCLGCHRDAAASIRPRALVTNLAWRPKGDPAALGKELMAANHVHPPTNCSGCHR